MNGFIDIDEQAIKGIKVPALILNGDRDVVQTANAVKLSQLITNARLAIVPSGHGDYLGEVCSPDPGSRLPEAVAMMIDDFLK